MGRPAGFRYRWQDKKVWVELAGDLIVFCCGWRTAPGSVLWCSSPAAGTAGHWRRPAKPRLAWACGWLRVVLLAGCIAGGAVIAWRRRRPRVAAAHPRDQAANPRDQLAVPGRFDMRDPGKPSSLPSRGQPGAGQLGVLVTVLSPAPIRGGYFRETAVAGSTGALDRAVDG
jgi:hypothetical protein